MYFIGSILSVMARRPPPPSSHLSDSTSIDADQTTVDKLNRVCANIADRNSLGRRPFFEENFQGSPRRDAGRSSGEALILAVDQSG
jgi:hypothetical protein